MPFYRLRNKKVRRFFKITGWSILSILAGASLFIVLTGRLYIFKGIVNTVMVGRLGPSISEYGIFYNRIIEAKNPHEWQPHKNFLSKQLRPIDLKRMEELETVSFLVLKDSALLYEKYFDEYNKDSITNSFSVAKSIVSLLVGIAIDEGHIKSLDEPVSNYLSGFRSGHARKLTIRHLLTMSSGSNWEEGSSPFSHNAEAYYGTDLKGLMKRIEFIRPPGKIFNYQSGNTQFVAMILEKATGKNISELAEEKLWKPLGATHNALWNLDDYEDNIEKAYCCFYATGRDFLRIGQLILNNGEANGKQIISRAYIKDATTPAKFLKTKSGHTNDRYGLAWWTTTYKGKKVVYARGILGQYIICIPSENMVIFRAGWYRHDRKINDHPQDLYWYIEAGLKLAE